MLTWILDALDMIICVLAVGEGFRAVITMMKHIRRDLDCITRIVFMATAAIVSCTVGMLYGVYMPLCVLCISHMAVNLSFEYLAKWKYNNTYTVLTMGIRFIALAASYLTAAYISASLHLNVALCIIWLALLGYRESAVWIGVYDLQKTNKKESFQ